MVAVRPSLPGWARLRWHRRSACLSYLSVPIAGPASSTGINGTPREIRYRMDELRLACGEPLMFPSLADAASLKKARQQLQDALDRVAKDARNALGLPQKADATSDVT
jgi:hypothetical protein